jgi:HAE1 family hydrophobic/amphiphilic exporter-1
MQWLAELCVKRPVLATVLSLVILVVGSVFYAQLGVDQFPKIDFPVIVVQTTVLPGSLAARRRDRHHRPHRSGGQHRQRRRRTALATAQRASRRSSFSSSLEKNVDVAAQEVQQKINLVLPELPQAASTRPSCMKFDPDASPSALHRAAPRTP